MTHEYKSVRVVSNGNATETKIYDKEDKLVGGVHSIKLNISCEDPIVKADMVIMLPKAEIIAFDTILNDKRTIEDEIFAAEFFGEIEFPVYEVGDPCPLYMKDV